MKLLFKLQFKRYSHSTIRPPKPHVLLENYVEEQQPRDKVAANHQVIITSDWQTNFKWLHSEGWVVLQTDTGSASIAQCALYCRFALYIEWE